MDILPDSIHIFRILFTGVSIVETQIASATKFLGDTEIHAYGFCMADMQIAVRFRRETGIQPSPILTGLKVISHNLLYKIQSLGNLGGFVIHIRNHND